MEVLGLYNKSRNLLIFAVYRQPDDRVGGNRSTAAEFKLSLEEIKKKLSQYMLIPCLTFFSVEILTSLMQHGQMGWQVLVPQQMSESC